jgi:phenylalanyl-tRNA synthetase beta chain
LIAEDWEIDATVAGFELDLDAVAPHAVTTPVYEDLTSFPEVREDLAVIVAQEITAERVLRVVRQAGAPLLQRADVFDVYRDAEKIGENNVSLAIRLSYRAPDRTLTDEQVAKQRETIAAALGEELGGRIRAS